MASDPWYFAGENEVIGLGDRRLTAYSRWGRRTRTLPVGLLNVLGPPGRRVSRSDIELAVMGEGHVGPLGQPRSPPEVIRLLTNDGFLIEPAELLARLEDPATVNEPITDLVVPTCDRPQLLSRCLSSYARNASKFGHQIRITVGDDSASSTGCSATQEAVAHVARHPHVTCHYVGRREKALFVDRLVSTLGLPPSVVRFALLPDDRHGWSFGANRNALMLATSGRLVLSVDDDTVCRVAGPLASMGRVAMGSVMANFDLTFCRGRTVTEVIEALNEGDFVTAHQRALGKPVLRLVRSSGLTTWCEGDLSPRLVGALRRGQARVLATTLGIAGDPATASRRWLLLLRGSARDAMLASDADYTVARSSDCLIRRAMSLTISDGEAWMSYCFGIDNRRALPPFFPYRGQEDSLFIAAALRCNPDGFVGYLPVALAHAPPAGRSYRPNDISAGFGQIGWQDIATGLITWATSSQASPSGAAAIRRLGSRLVEAGRDADGFVDLARDICWRIQHQRLVHLHTLRNCVRGPIAWQQDLEAQIRAVEESMLTPGFPSVDGAPPPGRPGRALAGLGEVRSDFLAYGELCRYWPDMVDASCELSAEGAVLAASIPPHSQGRA